MYTYYPDFRVPCNGPPPPRPPRFVAAVLPPRTVDELSYGLMVALGLVIWAPAPVGLRPPPFRTPAGGFRSFAPRGTLQALPAWLPPREDGANAELVVPVFSHN